MIIQKDYYKYLNGYRFVAVLLVIVTHWLPSYFEKLFFSKIGVDMFFVLSGFLISEILMRQKREFKKSINYDLKKILSNFYIRRFLRIFPIYYILIFCFVIISAPIVVSHLSYFVFYLTNILISRENNWIGMFSHLWSLAIEEQFYIIWPLILLTIPMKYLGKTIIAFILLSLLYVIFGEKISGRFYPFNIFSCISTLGAGALLAYLKIVEKIGYRRFYDYILLFLAVTSLTLFSFHILGNIFLLHLSTIVFSFCLVKILITTESTFFDLTLNSSIASYFGKISYGLYLYHNFIPWFLRNLNGTETELKFTGIPLIKPFSNGWFTLSAQFAILAAISIISWHVIEKPFNDLKKYFRSN